MPRGAAVHSSLEKVPLARPRLRGLRLLIRPRNCRYCPGRLNAEYLGAKQRAGANGSCGCNELTAADGHDHHLPCHQSICALAEMLTFIQNRIAARRPGFAICLEKSRCEVLQIAPPGLPLVVCARAIHRRRAESSLRPVRRAVFVVLHAFSPAPSVPTPSQSKCTFLANAAGSANTPL